MRSGHLKPLGRTALVCVLIAGAAAAWYGLSRRSTEPGLRRGQSLMLPDPELAKKAAEAVCVDVDTEEAASAAGEQFAGGVRKALEALPPSDRLESARAEAFARLAEERFAMFLRPDYARYCAQFKRLASASPLGPRSPAPPITAQQFGNCAARFKGARVAPGDVEIIVRYLRGASRGVFRRGLTNMATDEEGWYSDAGAMPLKPSLGADVYEARFPVEFADSLTGIMRRGFVGFALVWLPAEGRWLPWQSVLSDPTPTASVTFAPCL